MRGLAAVVAVMISGNAVAAVLEGFVAGEAVNVRHKPNGQLICTIQRNTHFQMLGPAPSIDWVKIKIIPPPPCNPQEGYIFRKYASDPILPELSETAAGEACATCHTGSKVLSADLPKVNAPLTDEAIAKYSASQEVENTIAYAKEYVLGRSSDQCYRFVKFALVHGDLVNKYLIGKFARDAGPALKDQGFVNLMETKPWKDKIKSPYDAPKGAVLVYKGGMGHIEIKTGDVGEGGFISDYYKDEPRTGTVRNGLNGDGRTLIGVYVKPGVGA